MKVGDLVKHKRPTTKNFNTAFLVTEFADMRQVEWIKVLGRVGWHRIADFEVIDESR